MEEYKQKPELEPIQQGLKTCAAIGYCASIFVSASLGQELPSNVTYFKNTGLIYIHLDNEHPLPFNSCVGDIVIGGFWHNNGGLMTIIFGDVDILKGKIKLYGINTVPVIYREEEPELGEKESIITLFAKQDIVVGRGSDTILHYGDITDIVFNAELARLDEQKPSDAFVAVKQNVWFIDIDDAGTSNNVYDDYLTINGGGQLVEASGSTGGILYHAIINTKVSYYWCNKNPIEGFALTQNLKNDKDLLLDLGNALISFHGTCDGMARVEFCSGKYMSYYGKNISLDIK
jgi:hypothetical protein